MFNKSEIMKKAWNIKKSEKTSMSYALKKSWSEAKSSLVLFVIKDWFANKIANEIKRNICSPEIFAILKETEKAVYAMISVSANQSKCVWVPKSCIEKNTGSVDFRTRTNISYEEAINDFHIYWSTYC